MLKFRVVLEGRRKLGQTLEMDLDMQAANEHAAVEVAKKLFAAKGGTNMKSLVVMKGESNDTGSSARSSGRESASS